MTAAFYNFQKPIKLLITLIPSIPKLLFSKPRRGLSTIIHCAVMRCHESYCNLIKMLKHLIMAATLGHFPKTNNAVICSYSDHSGVGILKTSYHPLPQTKARNDSEFEWFHVDVLDF
jgi:hypothetical protein